MGLPKAAATLASRKASAQVWKNKKGKYYKKNPIYKQFFPTYRMGMANTGNIFSGGTIFHGQNSFIDKFTGRLKHKR